MSQDPSVRPHGATNSQNYIKWLAVVPEGNLTGQDGRNRIAVAIDLARPPTASGLPGHTRDGSMSGHRSVLPRQLAGCCRSVRRWYKLGPLQIDDTTPEADESCAVGPLRQWIRWCSAHIEVLVYPSRSFWPFSHISYRAEHIHRTIIAPVASASIDRNILGCNRVP